MRLQLPHCVLAAPEGWVPVQPNGFRAAGDAPGLPTAQVLERFLDRPTPPAVHAELQKLIFRFRYRDVELVAEGHVRAPGPGQGHALTVRYRDEDGDETWERWIALTCGPLLAELSLTVGGAPSREVMRAFDAIAGAFELHHVDYLARAGADRVLLGLPEADAELATNGMCRLFPRLCVSLQAPERFALREDCGDAVLGRPGVEIRLRRDLTSSGEPGAWFGRRMAALRQSGSALLASEKGTLAPRRPYAAIVVDERSLEAPWSTAATRRAVEVLVVAEGQPLVWTLRAHPSALDDYRPVFERVVATTPMLDPTRWETRLPERWVDAVLPGPWRPAGGGTYVAVEAGGLCSLTLLAQPARVAAASVAGQALRSVEKSFAEIATSREVPGSLAGVETHCLTVQGKARDGRSMAYHGAWAADQGVLYSCVVQGVGSTRDEATFRIVLDGLRFPGMPGC